MFIDQIYMNTGFVITGRNACAFYDFCSRDDNLIFLKTEVFDEDFVSAGRKICVNTQTEQLPPTQSNNGTYAHIFKAVYNFTNYMYDDSVEEEILEELEVCGLLDEYNDWATR